MNIKDNQLLNTIAINLWTHATIYGLEAKRSPPSAAPLLNNLKIFDGAKTKSIVPIKYPINKY